MQGHKQYQEKLFVSFQLSDRVPENNFYRRLNNCLDLRFLYKATRKYYGSEGNPGLDPIVFFKLILVGYFQNLQSDRSIIEHSKLRLDVLFFIGYNIDEQLPWHSTLSRTRQLYGEEVFIALFNEVLKQCVDKGMVAGRRQVVDSVLVNANASLDSLVRKQILEDGAEYAKNLSEDDEIQSPEKKSSKHSNKDWESPTDKDARIARKPGKPTKMNYLGQVSVDSAHHVITNMEAHHADKRDSECFPDVLDHTIANLSNVNLKVEEVLADTNYSSPEAIKAAQSNNITAFIPNIGTYKSEKEGFIYNELEDYYECNGGAKLHFKRIRVKSEKQKVRDYASTKADCKECPLKLNCIGKKGYKRLSHSIEKELYDQMQNRITSHYGQQMKKKRQSTVEPVIGTLVNFLALKKLNTRGLAQANKIMIGAAIAYNLKKFMKWETKQSKIITLALPIPEKKSKTEQICQHYFNKNEPVNIQSMLKSIFLRVSHPLTQKNTKYAPAGI
jgi:transposase